jgi:dihydrofolate synthase/folylpolyglutamate synthase
MSYPRTLEFLFGLQRHGIKLELDTIEALLARVGDPHRRYRCLHIGGTNGKGSTAAMAASIARAAGYRVGLYTSPHLVDFRERIEVDGEPISESAVQALTDRLRSAGGRRLEPTFFEFTTALAFLWFAESDVEVAVVEVGMGGRFDATTVVTPLACTITNVALDHQQFLGHTIEAIAFEKAGIVKPGVPLVTGRLTADADGVVDLVARGQDAPRRRLGMEFQAEEEPGGTFAFRGDTWRLPGLVCPLAGRHQLDNAACAIALLEAAGRQGLPVDEAAVSRGLRETRWDGRLELAGRSPDVLLDGAHNPAAAQVLAQHLASRRRAQAYGQVIVVVGMMRDKDYPAFLDIVASLADVLILTQAHLPRAATVDELRGGLNAPPSSVIAISDPEQAFAQARRMATSRDLICVTGSLMLVGDIKALLSGRQISLIRG